MIEILLPASRTGARPELVSVGITAEELADCRHAAAQDGKTLEQWLVSQLRRRMEVP